MDVILRIIYGAIFVPLCILIACLYFLPLFGFGEYVILVTIVLALGFNFLSFGTVQNDEKATLEFFGKVIKALDHGAGLVYAPLGPWQITKEKTPTVTVELPGPKSKIFHGSEHEPLPEGLVRPFRLTSGSRNNFTGLRMMAKEYFAQPGNPNMDLDSRYANLAARVEAMISEIEGRSQKSILKQQTFMLQIFLRIRIQSPKYFQRNVGRYSSDQKALAISQNLYIGDDEYSKLRFEVAKLAQTIAMEITGKLTMSTIIEDASEINTILQAFMSAKVDGDDRETEDVIKVTGEHGNEEDLPIRRDSLGIVIEQAKIVTPDPGKTTSKALQLRTIAETEKATAIIKAEAEKEAALRKNEAEEDRLRKLGAGEAFALAERLKAEALGYKEIADKLKIQDPMEIFKIQQLLAILPKSNAQFIIGGDAGLNELFARIKNISSKP